MSLAVILPTYEKLTEEKLIVIKIPAMQIWYVGLTIISKHRTLYLQYSAIIFITTPKFQIVNHSKYRHVQLNHTYFSQPHHTTNLHCLRIRSKDHNRGNIFVLLQQLL